MSDTDVIQFDAEARKAHAADEAVIDRGLATFVEVGRALMRIRDRRSYLLTHTTFGAYVRERWRFAAPQAYRLIGGAEVVTILEGAGVEIKPSNANVAYELRSLTEDPKALVKAWRQALDAHGDKPIARDVASTIRNGDEPATEPEQELPNLAGDEASFAKAIVLVGAQIDSARDLQRSALGDVDPRVARDWARRIKRIRTVAADLQRAVDRKT